MSIFKKLFGRQPEENSPEKKAEDRSDGSRGNSILEFQSSINKAIEWNELNNVEFAMWLPCNEDKQFAKSPITGKWTAIYAITKHYWSYINGDVLKTLGVVEENTFRLGLPDDFHAFPFLTIEGEQIILSISKEKGIRLHFANTTSFEYRSAFMDKFISYCKAWKELIDLNNGDQDEDLGFDNWWTITVETSKAIEEKEPLTGVGKIAK